MTHTTTEKLIKFVNQRPNLDFNDYGDISAYRSESREITNDRKDFYEMLSLANIFVDDIETKLTAYLQANSGRLQINKEGNLEYCTGQYFPTEYRPAATNAIKSLVWAALANEKNADGTDTYKDGHEIRKVFKRRCSRRLYRLYFN